MQGSPDGVNASANHSDLEWDRVSQSYESFYKLSLQIFFNFHLTLFFVAVMAFNLRCSESMQDFSRAGMIVQDIPNVPDRGRSPPRGFFRSQIRAPCALIKDLSDRDQEIAMAFIKALQAQHRKRSSEKKKLRKKITRCYGESP
ncbi:hypothetical protein ISN44_As05g028180 [Arabidopsis suecica]|uniref:Uncharacterized protein n=1 Tax=Arabidopsis suecica TaxID=45249 RepID=A0A8T2DEQ4_ARASU|nr:hypothetical protein ISN44_As05g028180 [Arabidopsis suecica]